jgi:hypothetical protein
MELHAAIRQLIYIRNTAELLSIEPSCRLYRVCGPPASTEILAQYVIHSLCVIGFETLPYITLALKGWTSVYTDKCVWIFSKIYSNNNEEMR